MSIHSNAVSIPWQGSLEIQDRGSQNKLSLGLTPSNAVVQRHDQSARTFRGSKGPSVTRAKAMQEGHFSTVTSFQIHQRLEKAMEPGRPSCSFSWPIYGPADSLPSRAPLAELWKPNHAPLPLPDRNGFWPLISATRLIFATPKTNRVVGKRLVLPR